MIVFRVHREGSFFRGVYSSCTADAWLHDMVGKHPAPPYDWIRLYGKEGLFAFPSMLALHEWIFPNAMQSLIAEGGFVLSIVHTNRYHEDGRQLIFDSDTCKVLSTVELYDIADARGCPK